VSPDSPLLRITDLDVHYGSRRSRTQALHGASLDVHRGETVGIIGETGSGKSTLARAAVGLIPASAGSVSIGGEVVTGYSGRQWRAFRRRGVVQLVFQDPLRSLDPDATIRESLAEPLILQGRSSRAEIDHVIRTHLARVRLDDDVLDRLPGELSGGQRQRVAVARALVTAPDLVILDEPVSALDSANRVQVLEILAELRASGVALVFISHDLGSVAGITDRVAVLYRGSVVEVGATDAIVNRPQHQYTRLLVGSAPTLTTGSQSRAHRDELRSLVGTP